MQTILLLIERWPALLQFAGFRLQLYKAILNNIKENNMKLKIAEYRKAAIALDRARTALARTAHGSKKWLDCEERAHRAERRVACLKAK